MVAGDEPARIARLRVRNESSRERSLSVTAYRSGCWVLPARGNAPHVITERDTETGVLLARNAWNHAFPGVAFIDLGRAQEWTCDRREFLGRHGSLDAPAALVSGSKFSGRTGAALDPCGALRCRFTLAPGAATEFTLISGQAENPDAVRKLIMRTRNTDIDALLESTRAQWRDLTEHVQVKTPTAPSTS